MSSQNEAIVTDDNFWRDTIQKMKVYKNNDNSMVVTNVKEATVNNRINNRQNGQVMLFNTSSVQTSIAPQHMNQSILISTTPQVSNMPSSGKGDILLSNVHLVSALQSPIIWPGDGIIKQTTIHAADKAVRDNERIIRGNSSTIVANELTSQSSTQTFLTIMAPQNNTTFNNSQPQQLIMLGELAPNQILLTSPGLDENTEILHCKMKPVNTAETGRIKIEPMGSKVLVINEKSNYTQIPPSQSSLPPVNAVPTTDLSARVEVTDGRGSSKKRSRKVNISNNVNQTTTDSNMYPSTNRQDTSASTRMILNAADLPNQVASHPRSNQSSDGTNEIGYTAQLLSQLNDAGALPAISCSQVSSVLSALEPAGSAALTTTKQSQPQPQPRPQPPEQTGRVLIPNEQTAPAKSNPTPKTTRETNTKPVDSEKLKYHLRAQYLVLKQEDHANNLPGVYQCSECIYLSTKSSTIETHFERFHQFKSTVSLPKRNLLKCIGCSNVFYSKHALQVHLIQDHEASSAEVSVMTNIIVKSQTPEAMPKETRKKDVGHSEKSDEDIARPVNPVEQASAAKVDNTATNKSLVIEARRTIPTEAAVGCPSTTAACVPIDSVPSPVCNLNASTVELPTIDSTELTSIVDLTAQFSAAAQSLIPAAVHQDDIANTNKTVTKDEENADGFVNSNCVKMKEDDEKPTTENKSDVKLRAPIVPARKRGRPKCAQSWNHIKKKVTENKTDPESDKQKTCGIEDCGLKFSYEANLVYHHQCHRQDGFECPECAACKPKWANMAMHLWKAHNIDLELHSCDKCSYKTYHSKFVNIHALIHGHERPFLCDVCGKGFKTRKQMRNHKAMHKHNSEQESRTDGDANTANKFSCSVCGRKMKDGRNLRLHMENVHDKMRRYFCTFCSYTTYSRGSLLIHQRIHTGEKPFKCDSCDYATSDHNSLRRHKMQHSGNKPYNCPHCSYACIQSTTFKAHLKSKHPGLDSGLMFSCAECPFRTINKANLLSHSASHAPAASRQESADQLIRRQETTDPGTATSNNLQVLNLMSSASHFLVPSPATAPTTTATTSTAANSNEEPTPVSLEVAEIVDPALQPSPLPILGLPHGEIIISDHLGFEDSSESCEMIIPESQDNRR